VVNYVSRSMPMFRDEVMMAQGERMIWEASCDVSHDHTASWVYLFGWLVNKILEEAGRTKHRRTSWSQFPITCHTQHCGCIIHPAHWRKIPSAIVFCSRSRKKTGRLTRAGKHYKVIRMKERHEDDRNTLLPHDWTKSSTLQKFKIIIMRRPHAAAAPAQSD
jgi:hypothetical protein